jgi:hypothetical protein
VIFGLIVTFACEAARTAGSSPSAYASVQSATWRQWADPACPSRRRLRSPRCACRSKLSGLPGC